jgi:hypothetical protein
MFAHAPTKLDIVQEGFAFPRGFEHLPFTERGGRNAGRIGGGCGYADPAIMAKVGPWVLQEFAGMKHAVVASGITTSMQQQALVGGKEVSTWRDVEAHLATLADDQKDVKPDIASYLARKGFMITNLPALMREAGFDIITIGTAPRTGQMMLGTTHRTFYLAGEYTIDHHDHAVVFQKDALEFDDPDKIDWIADVPAWAKLHSTWQKAGVNTWWWGSEGGAGTEKEVKILLSKGIHCILTANSGRKSDVMVNDFLKGQLLVSSSEHQGELSGRPRARVGLRVPQGGLAERHPEAARHHPRLLKPAR